MSFLGIPKIQLFADIAFLVDASSIVSTENFHTAKEFVMSMAKLLNLSVDQTRAALITYSSFPKTVIQMGDYKLQDFNRAIAGATRHIDIKDSRIDLVIEEAFKTLSTPSWNSKKIVVILTSERHDRRHVNLLATAAEPLQNIGADIFVIAIGSKPNIEELLPIVSGSDHVFKVGSYQDLLNRNFFISSQIADKSGKKIAHSFLI